MMKEQFPTQSYEPPRVEVVEIMVEQGFVASVTVTDYNDGGSLGDYITE